LFMSHQVLIGKQKRGGYKIGQGKVYIKASCRMPDGCQWKTECKKSTDAAKWVEKKKFSDC